MKRREFIASSIAAGGCERGLEAGGSMAQAQTASQAYFELRRYELRGGPMADRMHEYLKNVSIPALNRAGVRPVGVFTPMYGALSPAIFLLLTYPSIQDFAGVTARLDADAEIQEGGRTACDPAGDGSRRTCVSTVS